MKILHSFDECSINKPSALTVGKFDGLHMGHYILIDRIVQKKTEGFLAIAVTFDRPPVHTISGKTEKVLMSQDEKRALMEHHGVDILVELPFDEAFMRMKADDFIRNLTENACRYTPEGGSILSSVSVENGRAVFELESGKCIFKTAVK